MIGCDQLNEEDHDLEERPNLELADKKMAEDSVESVENEYSVGMKGTGGSSDGNARVNVIEKLLRENGVLRKEMEFKDRGMRLLRDERDFWKAQYLKAIRKDSNSNE